VVARIASKDFSIDQTLESRILGAYGDRERVASAFFLGYTSGDVWCGSA
jgi:hypothetical protein